MNKNNTGKQSWSERVLDKAKQTNNKRTNIMFRLPSDVLDDFRKLCDKEGISMARAVTFMMKYFVEDITYEEHEEGLFGKV